MICKWVCYFGDYCYTTECGKTQGIHPKQKTCYCGKKIEKYIQNQYGTLRKV